MQPAVALRPCAYGCAIVSIAAVRAEDIVILVPYVGQLLRMRAQLAACNMRMVASERDEEDIAAVAEDEGASAEPSTSAAGKATGACHRRGWGAFGRACTHNEPWPLPRCMPSSRAGGLKGRVVTARELRVATVDNFQGEEAKIIILSTTRNNKDGRGKQHGAAGGGGHWLHGGGLRPLAAQS